MYQRQHGPVIAPDSFIYVYQQDYIKLLRLKYMLFFYDTNGKFTGSGPFDLVNLPTTFPTNLPADLPTSCFSY